jgi:hypothetical protein
MYFCNFSTKFDLFRDRNTEYWLKSSTLTLTVARKK